MTFLSKICIAILLGFSACQSGDKDTTDIAVKNNRAISRLKLVNLSGQSIDLSQYKGKTVFVNFWATWCKPCVEEMASIEKAQFQLQKNLVVFLLASNEAFSEISQFSANSGYKLNFVRIDNFEEQDIQALPTTFIFDSFGNLIFSESGMRKWDEPGNIQLITNRKTK
jgi:thiol-disulfide isomerase/thioredoxin